MTKTYHETESQFEAVQKIRRTRMVTKFLNSLESELRREVKIACQREFKDLNIVVE